jgi:hypothetical protein
VKEREEAIKKRRSEREVDGSLFFWRKKRSIRGSNQKEKIRQRSGWKFVFGGRREVYAEREIF